MILLITGGAGYIGSICVEELLRQGHEVIVVDNLQEGHREAVPPESAFYEGNFGDRALLETIFQKHSIDGVIHFAADTRVESSMIDPGQFFNNNVVNRIALLDVMRKFGCNRMIFSSTAAIYGEPQYNPVDENHSKLPVNPYGESKLMFEKILDWYHRAYGLKFNALRYFNAAGASRTSAMDRGFLIWKWSKPWKLSQGKQSLSNLHPEDPVIPRHWWHPRNWPTGNLAGIRNSQNWKKSSPQPGNGTESILMDTLQP